MSTEIRKVNPCQMVRLLGFFVPCRARRAPKSSNSLKPTDTKKAPHLPLLVSGEFSSNEDFIGAILKPLGRNDCKAISAHFDATPSSKFSAKFVYSFVTD